MKTKLVLFASIFSISFGFASQGQSQWGLTWVQTNNQFGVLTHWGVKCFAVNGTNLLAGTWGCGVPHSINNGLSWAQGTSGLTNLYVTALAVSGSKLFAGTNYHGDGSGVFLSIDNGSTWDAVNTGLPPNIDIYALAVRGTNLFAETQDYISDIGGVFLSTNNGTSWTEADAGLAGNVAAFAVSDTNLFAGINGNGVFLSTNDGTNWTAASTGLTGNGKDVRALAVIGTNLFAGSDGSGVFLSTDNGTSWTSVGTGLPANSHVYALAVSGTNLFAGTNPNYLGIGGGVFLSTNNGTTWESEGLSGSWVSVLAVSGSNLFAAGAVGDSVWQRPLSEMILSNTVPRTPATRSELQSYPNPFSQSTTISFSSAESGAAEVTIVNLLGTEVTRLFEGELDAGEHSFSWDANGAAAGTYFCIIRSNNRVERVSLVLEK